MPVTTRSLVDKTEPGYQILPVPFATEIEIDNVDCRIQAGAGNLGEGQPSAIRKNDAGRVELVHDAHELVFEVE